MRSSGTAEPHVPLEHELRPVAFGLTVAHRLLSLKGGHLGSLTDPRRRRCTTIPATTKQVPKDSLSWAGELPSYCQPAP